MPAPGCPPPVPVGGPAARFAGVRVWPGHEGKCAGAAAVWLPVEGPADGATKDARSNLPAGTGCRAAVRLWKSRRPVGQGDQPSAEGLGPGPFEGRWVPAAGDAPRPPAPRRRGRTGARG